MNGESPGPTWRDELGPLFLILVGIFVGVVVTGAVGALTTGSDARPDEPASVSCATFVDDDGNAGGVCFVYGDVQFEWVNDRNATNGTLTLEDLPTENSTVRRTP